MSSVFSGRPKRMRQVVAPPVAGVGAAAAGTEAALGLDRLIEGGRFGLRGGAEFFCQQPDELLVLAQSRRRLSFEPVEPDQVALGDFVQGIEAHPAAGVGNRGGAAALLGQACHEPLEQGAQLEAEALGLEKLPIVKLGTVGEGKTGQKWAGIEVGGLG